MARRPDVPTCACPTWEAHDAKVVIEQPPWVITMRPCCTLYTTTEPVPIYEVDY